jgi:hypothetical protein
LFAFNDITFIDFAKDGRVNMFEVFVAFLSIFVAVIGCDCVEALYATYLSVGAEEEA